MQKIKIIFFTYPNSLVWVDPKKQFLKFFYNDIVTRKNHQKPLRLQLIKNSRFVFREGRGLRVTSRAGEVVVSYYTCEGEVMEDVSDCSPNDTPGSLSLSYSSSLFDWSDRSDSATEADDLDGSAAWNRTNTSLRLVNLRLWRKILVKKMMNAG